MGKSQKNYLSIKSKLMAAVAMLLVASFMVVSSTYAWFTLSTAPEIKGIRTTIGANGSLEIALAEGSSATTPFNKEAVKTGVGTNGDYTTWGNLIDASDAKYGMDKITLLPSRLYLPTTNVTIDNSGETPVVSINEYLATSPLSTPVYGADGRISALEANTVFGIYDGTQFIDDDEASGLRAIGNASGMTKQQSVYRQAKQDVSTYLTAAQTKAVASLQANGNDLATLIAAYATTSTAESTYDITCVANMVTVLQEANNNIEQAIRSYFKAVMAKELEDKDEAVFNTAVTTFDSLTIKQLVDGGAQVGDYRLPAVGSFNAAIGKVCAKWTAIDAALTAATGALEGVTVGAATAANLQAVLITSGLMNVDGVTINGMTKDEIKGENGMSQLATAVFDAGGIYVQLPKGSGVYADIAEVSGNYKVPVVIKKIAYGNFALENQNATMITTVRTEDIINLKAQIPEAPEAVGGGNAAITDFYGYAIDLVFRTNAKDSNLMLQTTPEQRIYSDSTNQQTLGSGSKMIFAPGSDNFTSAQMKELMSAIRIVFTTKDELGTKIVAIAGLDADNAVATAAGGYEVSVKLLDYSWTVDFAEDGTTPTGIVLDIKDENKFKANEATEKDADGAIVPSTTKFAQTLMALNQNEATVLTAMVYLDGDYVDNADVAANGTSMMGTLSLQFSSDVELTPMMNTPLFEGTEGGGETPAESN